MKFLLTLISFVIVSSSFAQTKDSLVNATPLDSIVQYEGQGNLAVGNCLILKFTGDAKQLFTELAFFHANDEDQVERTQTTLAIYETTKPYWIYGTYSVFAEMWPMDNYTYIEIYFKGYSNPENLRIYGAARQYQLLINKVLKK